tara:strand:+ start:2400 stop:3767 length:1368 start_codon:yes stop_codon:yes gene_type:complete
MDRILNRKLFRQKALDTYGTKIVTKAAVGKLAMGGGGILSVSQERLAEKNKELENFTNTIKKPKRTNNETFMGFGGEGSAVSADQARLNILLPIAAQLMTGTVRPGQSKISGLLESTGKGLASVGPTILAMKDLDLKKRKEDREALTTGGEGKMRNVILNLDLPGIGKKGDAIPLLQSQIVALQSEYGPKGITPVRFQSTMEEEAAKARATKNAELVLTQNQELTKQLEKSGFVLGLSDFVLDDLSMDFDADTGRGASLGTPSKITGFLTNLISTVKTTAADAGFSEYGYDAASQQYKPLADALQAKDLTAKQIKEIFKEYKDDDGVSFGNDKLMTTSRLTRLAALDGAARTKVIELAYAIAKAREEGGRFSVSDIELALLSIGDTADKEVAISKLKALQKTQALKIAKKYENMAEFKDMTPAEIVKADARFKPFYEILYPGRKKKKKKFDLLPN